MGHDIKARLIKASSWASGVRLMVETGRLKVHNSKPFTYLWLVGNGRMVVIVVCNCTPFLHSLLTKGKFSRNPPNRTQADKDNVQEAAEKASKAAPRLS